MERRFMVASGDEAVDEVLVYHLESGGVVLSIRDSVARSTSSVTSRRNAKGCNRPRNRQRTSSPVPDHLLCAAPKSNYYFASSALPDHS